MNASIFQGKESAVLMSKVSRFTLISLAVTCLCASALQAAHFDPQSDTFTFFAWRSLGHLSNDMPHVKIKCFLGSDDKVGTGETGMAVQGWHELHPHPGWQTAVFDDSGDAIPTFAGPVSVGHDPKEWAVLDVPIYWLYQADNLVWSQEFTQFGQTFVPTHSELDKVSVQTVRDCTDLVVTVRKGGPNGEQVGPIAMLEDGPGGDGTRAGWRIARWQPEDMMLEVGKPYYLDVRSKSGKKFSLRCHSTGNIYPDGIAYFDGVADPMSDLGIFFAFQRDDSTRSKILYTHEDGWVRKARGVYFKARSQNIRGIYATISWPTTPKHIDVLFRVYKVGLDGQLVRVGMDKSGYNYTSPGQEHRIGAIYPADGVPLEIGSTYYLEVIPRSEALPENPDQLPKMDLNVRIYGEKVAGMNPVIFNQHVAGATSNSIKLAWDGTQDVDTYIHYGLNPYKLDKTIRIRHGVNEAAINNIAPATTVSFRLAKTSAAGGKFETPVYQARTPDASGNAVSDPPLLETPQHKFLDMCIGFLNLAVMDRMYQPQLPEAKVVGEVAVANAGFENGAEGWTVDVISDQQKVPARTSKSTIAAQGKTSLGWDIDIKPEQAEDVEANEVVCQKVKVTPGKTYMLFGSLYTLQNGHDTAFHNRFNWGDVKARLICDPSGGTDFSGHNSTQWFRTDGRWLTFAKTCKAESDTITIGVGFMAKRNWPRVVALADDIKLVEIRD